ncbi:MAG: DUF1833 family protein [Glycocaulis sp.]
MPSARFLKALLDESSDEPVLALLTVTHPDLAEPLRLVNNDEDITSRGDVFLAYPFRLTLPEQGGPGDKSLPVQFDNVDRQIAATLRQIVQPADVMIEVILPSHPDDVEMRFGPGLTLRAADWDAATVNAYLAFDEDGGEPVCAWVHTPAASPGLFG